MSKLSLQDVSVGHKLWSIVGVAVVALGAFAAVSMTTMADVRIGSERYRDIAATSELLADVLPPPAYLVEANLVAHRMLTLAEQADSVGLAQQIDGFGSLQAAFEERHEYWDRMLTDEASRSALLDAAYEPGVAFFRLAEDEFVPALRTGRLADAESLLDGPMQEEYAAHRSGIDTVVERTMVVGDEVTGRAVDAAAGSTRRVGRIQTDAADAIEALGEIQRIVGTVSDAQAVIAAAVEEQTATTSEIARSIADAARAATSIAAAVATTAAANTETAAGSVSTRSSAAAVAGTAEQLQQIVGQFRA